MPYCVMNQDETKVIGPIFERDQPSRPYLVFVDENDQRLIDFKNPPLSIEEEKAKKISEVRKLRDLDERIITFTTPEYVSGTSTFDSAEIETRWSSIQRMADRSNDDDVIGFWEHDDGSIVMNLKAVDARTMDIARHQKGVTVNTKMSLIIEQIMTLTSIEEVLNFDVNSAWE